MSQPWMPKSAAMVPLTGQKWNIPFAILTDSGIKVYTGTAHVRKPVKAWMGAAWVEKPVKNWAGGAWVNT